MSHLLKRKFQQFLFAVSDDFAELPVHAQPASVRSHMRNAHARDFERGAVELLALAQRLLERPAALDNFLNIRIRGAGCEAGK